jgi:ribose/xylose/arabinose/galactoside ABC-type transport system permease subunit
MKPRTAWLYAVAGLAAALVAVSAVVQSVREGSWSPLISVSWLLAVVAATWPPATRRCLPRRRQAR